MTHEAPFKLPDLSPNPRSRRIEISAPEDSSLNVPGKKDDSGKPRVGLVLGGFANAILAVSEVSTFGAAKYTPDGWVSVPDGINRYTDAFGRHLLLHNAGQKHDAETNLKHLAHAAWNVLAILELTLRKEYHEMK